MKQVYRRCWDHCIRFILAYSIWYELATKNTQESGMSFPCPWDVSGPFSEEGQLVAPVPASLWNSTGRTHATSSGKETPPFPTSTSSYFVFCVTVILKLQRLLIFCHIYLPSQIEYTLSFGIVQRNQTEPEKEAPFLAEPLPGTEPWPCPWASLSSSQYRVYDTWL